MYSFEEFDSFLSIKQTKDVKISPLPKLGAWRVELLKLNRTGQYTLRFGNSGYNPQEFRYYIENKRLDVPKITDGYVKGDTFSIIDVACGSEQEAQDYCYETASRYKNDELFVLSRGHSYFFKTLPHPLLEAIDGAVAGDGSIIDTTDKAGMFLYQLGEKQLPHMEEFYELLQSYGYDGDIKKYRGKLNGEPYFFYSLTWFLRCLRLHRDRWYGSDRKKKLPDDVSNTPAFWRWFYAGDGTFAKSGKFGGHATLCVNDFSTIDVERLQSMLLEHDIVSRKWAMKNQGTVEKPQWLIWMFGENARKFLKMTSPAVRGLEYKWEIPEIPTYVCDYCKNEFKPYRADMLYCTPGCRVKKRNKVKNRS